jgi:hypothetical protein
MSSPRVVAWFSCGAASAVAAKMALDKFGPGVEVVYCDTSRNEHPDNARFMADVERWLGVKVSFLSSEKFKTVEEVFAKQRYMAGPHGAPCTVALKKVPRFKWQRADDIHVFGYTVDEERRIKNFEKNNPDMVLSWVLRDGGITKQMCYRVLTKAEIALPAMYLLGYKNNNCLGCVKATSPGYWAKIKRDFPQVYADRVTQSRDIGTRLVEFKGKRIFLDELPDGDYGRYKAEDISCGPECQGEPR